MIFTLPSHYHRPNSGDNHSVVQCAGATTSKGASSFLAVGCIQRFRTNGVNMDASINSYGLISNQDFTISKPYAVISAYHTLDYVYMGQSFAIM